MPSKTGMGGNVAGRGHTQRKNRHHSVGLGQPGHFVHETLASLLSRLEFLGRQSHGRREARGATVQGEKIRSPRMRPPPDPRSKSRRCLSKRTRSKDRPVNRKSQPVILPAQRAVYPENRPQAPPPKKGNQLSSAWSGSCGSRRASRIIDRPTW